MMTDEQLVDLLRRTMDPTPETPPSRDLWPVVVTRTQDAPGWTWVDLAMAAALVAAVALRPEWFWLLAYHL